MVPWPLARFGAAAQLLGRPSEQWLPVTAGLGPELLAETRVVLGADLETIGLTTQLDAADPAAVQRAANLGGGSLLANASGPVGLTIMMSATGSTCSIEQRTSTALAQSVSSRLGPLAPHVDHTVTDSTGARRVGLHTTDRDAVAALLERSRIARAQQSYFADTVAVWTKWDPTMTVRVAVDASGPLGNVEVSFGSIPGEHLVRVWRTFSSRPDLAQRIGAFVGAMGVETAARLSLHLSASSDPTLDATFVPASTPFAPVARR